MSHEVEFSQHITDIEIEAQAMILRAITTEDIYFVVNGESVSGTKEGNVYSSVISGLNGNVTVVPKSVNNELIYFTPS